VRELEAMFEVFENTMSVHLRENRPMQAKHGKPGEWDLDVLDEEVLNKEYLMALAESILQLAQTQDNAFIEDDQELVQVVQLENFRIVITSPPFSDAHEITIVRPTMQKSFDSYQLSNVLVDRLEDRAEGILIAGAPGHGKSTFAAALTNLYADQNKIIKTIEKPRDLQLDDRVTQFTMLPSDIEKLADVILLMRPDYVIFDEIRKNVDFSVYTDMRLAGVGMVGVIHATKPIEAVQRFVSRIELGLIPSIIDTIIFIKNGEVDGALSLKMVVKTPAGFRDESLARPVIEVRDFLDKRPLYEMFSFGEQVVVIPVDQAYDDSFRKRDRRPRKGKSWKSNQKWYDKHKGNRFSRPNNYVPDEFVFNQIEIVELKNHLILKLGNKFANQQVQLMIGPQVIMNTTVDNRGDAKLARKKATTKRLERMLDSADEPLSVQLI
jgi:ATPase